MSTSHPHRNTDRYGMVNNLASAMIRLTYRIRRENLGTYLRGNAHRRRLMSTLLATRFLPPVVLKLIIMIRHVNLHIAYLSF